MRALRYVLLCETVEETTELHLFIWAIVMGDDRLAELIRARCDLPVRMALFGSYMCKFMAASRQTAWGQSRIKARARELESWATGVLDACPSQAPRGPHAP